MGSKECMWIGVSVDLAPVPCSSGKGIFSVVRSASMQSAPANTVQRVEAQTRRQVQRQPIQQVEVSRKPLIWSRV